MRSLLVHKWNYQDTICEYHDLMIMSIPHKCQLSPTVFLKDSPGLSRKTNNYLWTNSYSEVSSYSTLKKKMSAAIDSFILQHVNSLCTCPKMWIYVHKVASRAFPTEGRGGGAPLCFFQAPRCSNNKTVLFWSFRWEWYFSLQLTSMLSSTILI